MKTTFYFTHVPVCIVYVLLQLIVGAQLERVSSRGDIMFLSCVTFMRGVTPYRHSVMLPAGKEMLGRNLIKCLRLPESRMCKNRYKLTWKFVPDI